MAAEPRFDLATALRRLGGDTELYRSVAGIFLGQQAALREAVRRAVADADAASVHRAAHALKGAVAQLGGPRAQEAAFAMEQHGRSGDLGPAPEALTALETELDAFVRELEAWLDGSD